ncbi:Cellulose 1,4-beta-cellobiosidase precursor [compost metagenome]
MYYPKGWLSGGPNNKLINDPVTPTDQPAAKSYASRNTAPDAWCSKENTINWNAPLVWVSKYIQENLEPLIVNSTR